MRKKANQTSKTGGVQVFELTMDNREDQDELNRRLRKPSEPDPCLPPKIGRAAHGESPAAVTAEDAEALVLANAQGELQLILRPPD
jgi:hypothetical protein